MDYYIMVFLLQYYMQKIIIMYQIHNLIRLQKYIFITPNPKDYGWPAIRILICPLGTGKGYSKSCEWYIKFYFAGMFIWLRNVFICVCAHSIEKSYIYSVPCADQNDPSYIPF